MQTATSKKPTDQATRLAKLMKKNKDRFDVDKNGCVVLRSDSEAVVKKVRKAAN
ncbi:hypothetical protein [Vibrio parahaemolyticus]|uniref:hypothetical protein n=1 Tax=Vibrio parahaemolyticus TaxID=670 RepID=UPI0015DECC4D|nr:hypothetical protein [Vibrio parahaemolyticus]MDG3409475.1 hypothetical protein [Vibrio parahaemolyticus]HCH4212533.1 hypothetical protein [Vibrio parahaemolyticus]